MRWGIVGLGIVLAAVGLLLTTATIVVTLHVYEEDGLLSWRVPGGIVFTCCALYMTCSHVWACIEAARAA